MHKVALVVAAVIAVVAFAAMSPPPVEQLVEGQIRCGNNRTCIGGKGADGKVPDLEVASPLLLDKPIYPTAAQTTVLIDGGVAINGALTVRGGVTTLAAIDAGAIYVQGGGPITRVLPFTQTALDFASTTTTCNDSAGTTVTGAQVADSCFVGAPSSGGSANATYSCYVSATNTVKIRHCAAGTADDPASATFTGFVISQQ